MARSTFAMLLLAVLAGCAMVANAESHADGHAHEEECSCEGVAEGRRLLDAHVCAMCADEAAPARRLLDMHELCPTNVTAPVNGTRRLMEEAPPCCCPDGTKVGGHDHDDDHGMNVTKPETKGCCCDHDHHDHRRRLFEDGHDDHAHEGECPPEKSCPECTAATSPATRRLMAAHGEHECPAGTTPIAEMEGAARRLLADDHDHDHDHDEPECCCDHEGHGPAPTTGNGTTTTPPPTTTSTGTGTTTTREGGAGAGGNGTVAPAEPSAAAAVAGAIAAVGAGAALLAL